MAPSGIAVALGRQEARPCIDAGIGEDHVDPPMPFRHGVESRGHPAAVGHVQGLAPDIAAAGHHLGDDRLETLCVDVEDADTRAVVRHDLGIGASDAARTAGDDDRLASHIEHLLQRRHASSHRCVHRVMRLHVVLGQPGWRIAESSAAPPEAASLRIRGRVRQVCQIGNTKEADAAFRKSPITLKIQSIIPCSRR